MDYIDLPILAPTTGVNKLSMIHTTLYDSFPWFTKPRLRVVAFSEMMSVMVSAFLPTSVIPAVSALVRHPFATWLSRSAKQLLTT